jgi:hypothetical protein
VLPDVSEGQAMRRRLHQRREAMPGRVRMRPLGRIRTMTEADRLLRKILAAGDVVWRDAAERTKLLLTLDAGDLERQPPGHVRRTGSGGVQPAWGDRRCQIRATAAGIFAFGGLRPEHRKALSCRCS